MKNRLLAITQKSIPYIKELRPIAGSVTAVILWQQLDYWFSKYPDGFFKFMSPPEQAHESYKIGDSWSEELGFSDAEFRNAFDRIGVRHGSKTAFNKAQNPFLRKDKELFFTSYQDKLKKMTFYFRNHDLADAALDNLVVLQPRKKAKQSASTVDKQSASSQINKVELPTSTKLSYPAKEFESGVSENTSKITSETTAENKNVAAVSVDNSLSKEQITCWEWAKKDSFWNQKVYSEEAFLKLYNSEKGTLKSQYANWVHLNAPPAPKAKPKEIWEKLGFNSLDEYGKSQFNKMMDKNKAMNQ